MAKDTRKSTPSIHIAQQRKALAAAQATMAAPFAGMDRVIAAWAAQLEEFERRDREYERLRDQIANDLRDEVNAPLPKRQKTTRRNLTKQDLVKAVMRELWPNGKPEATPGELLQQLGDACGRRGIHVSATTLRRALDLRRR